MTDFAFWQRETNKSGLVLCMVCFDSKNPALMHHDEEGAIWDVCEECWDA